MTKADLKNGMVVRSREGNFYLYLESCENFGKYKCGVFIDITKQGWNPLDDYDDDLRMADKRYDEFDVVAVYNLRAREISGLIADREYRYLGDPILEEAIRNVETDTTARR